MSQRAFVSVLKHINFIATLIKEFVNTIAWNETYRCNCVSLSAPISSPTRSPLPAATLSNFLRQTRTDQSLSTGLVRSSTKRWWMLLGARKWADRKSSFYLPKYCINFGRNARKGKMIISPFSNTLYQLEIFQFPAATPIAFCGRIISRFVNSFHRSQQRQTISPGLNNEWG